MITIFFALFSFLYFCLNFFFIDYQLALRLSIVAAVFCADVAFHHKADICLLFLVCVSAGNRVIDVNCKSLFFSFYYTG